MEIKLDIPDNQKSRVLDAFAIAYNRPEKILDENGQEIDNPVSKKKYMKQVIKRFMKEIVISVETEFEVEKARKIAKDKAEKDIDLGE